MSIWALADLHASRIDPQSGQPIKPMDIFGGAWLRHMDVIEQAWNDSVAEGDTVLLPGDIDWALHLEEASETLQRLHAWKGKKVLTRGNHDYWWSSKATSKVRRALPSSIVALHNDSVRVDGFNLCGAKGSPVPGGIDWSAQEAKLLNRELERLSHSLQSRDATLPTIVALHYPPFYPAFDASPYRDLLEMNGVACCVYGHLHGDAASAGPRGLHGNVHYLLVAADAVGFRPVLIARDGELVA